HSGGPPHRSRVPPAHAVLRGDLHHTGDGPYRCLRGRQGRHVPCTDYRCSRTGKMAMPDPGTSETARCRVTVGERQQTARARAHHLAVALSATAAGVFEPEQPMLDALALL